MPISTNLENYPKQRVVLQILSLGTLSADRLA
jgi:hypothetical protein